jgi:hypothetical protein
MKRSDLLNRMARLAKRYGFEFSKTPDTHGGSHDKWYVRGDAITVPRHAEVNELTARASSRNGTRRSLGLCET